MQLFDTNNSALRKGYEGTQSRISKAFSRMNPQSSKQETDHLAADVIDRLRISHTLEEAVCGAGLIIEAVKEDRLVKSDIFRDIFSMKTLSDKAIIVTNTSSFQVREFSILSTIFAPRMAGLHFFNPVDKMKLVEIVQTEQVEPSVIETLKQFVQSISKLIIIESVDSSLVKYLFFRQGASGL